MSIRAWLRFGIEGDAPPTRATREDMARAYRAHVYAQRAEELRRAYAGRWRELLTAPHLTVIVPVETPEKSDPRLCGYPGCTHERKRHGGKFHGVLCASHQKQRNRRGGWHALTPIQVDGRYRRTRDEEPCVRCGSLRVKRVPCNGKRKCIDCANARSKAWKARRRMAVAS